MPVISYKGKSFESLINETVLDTFLRNGETVPFSCRSGTCQTCLMKSEESSECAKSQKGLSQNLLSKNYFLPCVCNPSEDMSVAAGEPSDFLETATVVARELLNDEVIQIRLIVESDFQYRPGQYIHLRYKGTEETRPYSLASLPLVDIHLELHVKKVADGKFSNWIFEDLHIGDKIKIQHAVGSCYYQSENKRKNLLLIGTGTGLAPLLGIIKDALILNDHRGAIFLYHGGSDLSQLYMQGELRDLEILHENFHYVPCVSSGAVPLGHKSGRANMVAFGQHKELAGWGVYLCGQPDMVKDAADVALSFGVEEGDIRADAFDFQNVRQGKSRSDNTDEEQNPYEFKDEKTNYPEPDPEMWDALGEGELLTKILTEFYTIVFDDPRLSPFFSHVTKQRLIEKQYNFLYQTFTGKKVYFGASLRNAHHWMVISNELFDYRASILRSLMIKYGLEDHLVEKWCAIEEASRHRIVKQKPWDKVLDGKTVKLDKFEEATMEVPSLCDSCQSEIKPGEKIRYHLRLGKVYCHKCAGIMADDSGVKQRNT